MYINSFHCILYGLSLGGIMTLYRLYIDSHCLHTIKACTLIGWAAVNHPVLLTIMSITWMFDHEWNVRSSSVKLLMLLHSYS